MFTTLFTTVLAAKEKQFTGQTQKTNILMVFGKIFKAFINMPKDMVLVVILFYFSWSSYTPLMFYQTQYYQDYLYDGESFGLRIGTCDKSKGIINRNVWTWIICNSEFLILPSSAIYIKSNWDQKSLLHLPVSSDLLLSCNCRRSTLLPKSPIQSILDISSNHPHRDKFYCI